LLCHVCEEVRKGSGRGREGRAKEGDGEKGERREGEDGLQVTDGYWAEEKHRREFFDNFAKDLNFDPLTSDNWHKTTKNMLCDREVLFPSLFLNFFFFTLYKGIQERGSPSWK
jgi:hypothetical protein